MWGIRYGILSMLLFSACNELMNFIVHLNNDNALLIGNGGK